LSAVVMPLNVLLTGASQRLVDHAGAGRLRGGPAWSVGA
jgi:hypothetical protein